MDFNVTLLIFLLHILVFPLFLCPCILCNIGWLSVNSKNNVTLRLLSYPGTERQEQTVLECQWLLHFQFCITLVGLDDPPVLHYVSLHVLWRLLDTLLVSCQRGVTKVGHGLRDGQLYCREFSFSVQNKLTVQAVWITEFVIWKCLISCVNKTSWVSLVFYGNGLLGLWL